ncbi:hypothetical protein SAMN04488029_1473 [Reichenbachiella faecimaris]|uniref:Uncharacterized protein n=1 Tax=Reichenbachiella faecimaris TaxID=692418 RepID=A0A1W2G9S5_REIFA|nr:hypothetical protein [Reichenbachiella faecimaris]SMD33108.1 hypothetical protein SAMN04488029_1473 [Reichenbachiella faecimaris]
MTQAILEIAGMLLGALAIGIFFTHQYWKSKSGLIARNNESLERENEGLKSKERELEQKLKNQKSEIKPKLSEPVETSSENGKSDELEAELKSLGKEIREQKKKTKELRATVKTLKHDLEIKDEQLGEKERELEEISGHFQTHNISYYKQIDGKRYKAATLVEADDAIAGVGDGRISKADAEKIFATISDGHTYTQVEKDTMHYIRENYNWTPEADDLFRTKVRSWAAKGHQLD